MFDPLRLHLNGYKRVSGDFYVCIHFYPLVSSSCLHLAIQVDTTGHNLYPVVSIQV